MTRRESFTRLAFCLGEDQTVAELVELVSRKAMISRPWDMTLREWAAKVQADIDEDDMREEAVREAAARWNEDRT